MSETDARSPMSSSAAEHRIPPGPRGGMRDLVRDPLNFFVSLTRQYGDVVRYRAAPEPACLINHPEYIKHVLVANNRNYSKATYINNMFKTAVADGLLTSEGEVWRQQRRLMQPAFHRQRIAGLDALVTGETTTMLEGWQRAARDGETVDMAKEMASLTLTITGKALFGVDIHKEAGFVGQAVSMAADLLERPHHSRFQEALQAVEQIVYEIIDEHRRSQEDTGDLLSMLLHSRDEETGASLDDHQLRDQVITLLLAGYETTASALTWTWFLLSQNPVHAERLHSEVHGTLGGRIPNSQDFPRLQYTRMVFEEALRVYPPAWILGRKALGDDEIGGYHIPAGTIVAISPYAVHRHLDFWEDPETFNPERFTLERSASRHHFAYLPFGAGPRQCIGNNFAMLEAQLIIATIAQRFAIHLVPDQGIRPQPLFILRPSQAILMDLEELPLPARTSRPFS